MPSTHTRSCSLSFERVSTSVPSCSMLFCWISSERLDAKRFKGRNSCLMFNKNLGFDWVVFRWTVRACGRNDERLNVRWSQTVKHEYTDIHSCRIKGELIAWFRYTMNPLSRLTLQQSLWKSKSLVSQGSQEC